MGNQFNWQIEEEGEEPEPRAARRSRWTGRLLYTGFAVLVVGALLGGWIFTRERGRESQQQLIEATQALLDLERQALVSGDGELYFSLQENDPDWFSAQLLPQNQEVIRAGLQITNVEEKAGMIWANATWSEGDDVLQRVLFFESRAGQLRRLANDPDYWGAELQREEDWGDLTYYAVDDSWASSIANFIANNISEICMTDCLDDRLPITVHVRDDFQETAESNQINIPSPRLLGLNADGSPSSRFWLALGQRIDAYLTPAIIRFAVPPPTSRDRGLSLPYRLLAERYMAANPGISIEIVNLEELPEDLTILALEFDGAAVPPTEEMLASGLVHDLTDYVRSDPEFDAGDFYEQIWQGALWRDRTWFMPEAAKMHLLYYDKSIYAQAGHTEPYSHWTWDEMAQDVGAIVADQPQATELRWGFLDVGLNSLFSYAYNWNNQCAETVTIFCRTPLQAENIAAALAWYNEMAHEAEQMPNIFGDLNDILSANQVSSIEAAGPEHDQERQAFILLNFQGSGRKAAIWVDSPVNYEFNSLMAPVGIVPFPGSDRFDGITPLWLSGSFISQQSERPLAVWQWLKFLSYQAPVPRLVPARPSVAAEMGYWTKLPWPLGDVMRTAFPFARPVTIAEKERLTWELVSAVVNREITPEEAARLEPDIEWFNQVSAEIGDQ